LLESLPPLPPPIEVIVENIEGFPCEAQVPIKGDVDEAPPPPTVIGKDVPPVNVNFVPPGKDVR
jgi:hypothetical protein